MLTIALLFAITISGAASAVDTNSHAYTIGQNVTQTALSDKVLAMNESQSNLVITTAGTASLNGNTTQDGVQAVVDYTSTLKQNESITYGSGNLLTINNPNGALEYTFVSHATNGGLWAKHFGISSTGTITASDSVYINAAAMTQSQWNYAVQQLGSNAFNLICIANLWANGAPADLLAETFTTGRINQAIIADYAKTKSFALKYTAANGGQIGSNYVITNGGGEATIYGIFGFNDEVFATTSGTPGETAFINYATTNGARSGTLALMKGNDLTSQYGSVTAGTLSEIQFDLWLLNVLKTHPQDLFTVLAFKNVNEANIQYLWFDNATGYGNGLDEAYIYSLTNVSEGWTSMTNIIPITDYNTMYALGQQAFQYALSQNLFTASDLASGNVAVITGPYYVNHMGTRSLVGLMDGVIAAANAYLKANGYNQQAFTIDTALTIRNPWFWTTSIPVIFAKVTEASQTDYAQTRNMSSLVMWGTKSTFVYNATSKSYGVTNTGMTNLSPSQIEGATLKKPGYISPLGSFIIPAPAGLMYAWAAGAPYNYIRTISRVGCICSTKEYDLSSYLQEQYPLLPGEFYILTVLTGAGETNRQISGRTAAWGVSTSLGTYYSVGQTSDAGYQLIVTIWNSLTNTGRSMLIAYNSKMIEDTWKAEGYINYAQENDLFWHLDHVWNNGVDANILGAAITTAKTITSVNKAFLIDLNAAGGDPIQKMLNYVAPVTPTNPTNTGSQGTSGTVYAAISGALTSAWNSLTASSANTASNEIAPGLPLGQTTPANTSTGTSTGANSGLPLGAIIGIIVLAIAAIIAYFGRETISAAVTGSGGPGK